MPSDYDLDDARTALENITAHNPMTWNPWFNFLTDVVLGLMDKDEWEEVKDMYHREVEAYNRDEVDLEPYEVEELL